MVGCVVEEWATLGASRGVCSGFSCMIGCLPAALPPSTSLGPPAKNETPRGGREQRGAKKYSRNKGVRGVFVLLFFFFKTARTAK
jgi:hypothetical protein